MQNKFFFHRRKDAENELLQALARTRILLCVFGFLFHRPLSGTFNKNPFEVKKPLSLLLLFMLLSADHSNKTFLLASSSICMPVHTRDINDSSIPQGNEHYHQAFVTLYEANDSLLKTNAIELGRIFLQKLQDK